MTRVTGWDDIGSWRGEGSRELGPGEASSEEPSTKIRGQRISTMRRIIQKPIQLTEFAMRRKEYLAPAVRSLLFTTGRLRISIAAILCIEKDQKYVLIKNKHHPTCYAPFGGVVKHSESPPLALAAMQWRPDHGSSTDPMMVEDMNCDLRGFIEAWRLPDFLEWFDERTGREEAQAVNREFREELEQVRLPRSLRDRAARVRFEFVRRVLEGPHRVENGSCECQFRLIDVYKIDPACRVGKAVATELAERAARLEKNLILVSEARIFDPRALPGGEEIAGSATYFFTSRWHGRPLAPSHYGADS